MAGYAFIFDLNGTMIDDMEYHAKAWSDILNKYQEAFRPHLSLIKGLDQFLKKTEASGISMAVGTAAIPINIDFVLDGLNIRHYFKAIVSADDVIKSKPDPETFTKCAELLHVRPENCIVFEDAPKGVEAAENAGMSCVVITTMHPQEEFKNYKNIISFIEDYTSVDPQTFAKTISQKTQ